MKRTAGTNPTAGTDLTALLRLALAVLVALFAILTLLDRFVLVELLVRRIGIPVLFAAAQCMAIIGTGALVRRTSRFDAPLDLLIGYPIFGTLCFLVGTLKVNGWTMGALIAIGVVAGGARWIAGRRSAERSAAILASGPPASRRPDDATKDSRRLEAGEPAGWKPALRFHWAALLCLAVLACAFVSAQAPPSSLDELAYHLAVPHTWVLEGRAVALPLLSHSWFPLGIESADLPSLALLGAIDGGIASHFLHLFAAMATTLLIARRSKSWLATAAIVTTPALAATAGWSLVDWPLAGLFVALFVAEDDDTASAVTAAGLLTKYTFLPFALIAWAWRRKLPKPVALLGLVFFARNMILTGNPIAPFFSAGAPHVAGYRALELAGYVFDGAFIDEALGASLLILPILATAGLALAALAIALALFFLAPSSRILIPFLAVPAVDAAPALRRRTIAVLVSIAIVVQTLIAVWLTATGGAFAILTGTASDEQYLRKARPSYASIEWLNQMLPAGSRTLVVGFGETYWFARPVRGGGNFDGARISRYLDLPTPEALRARLRADGITHIAIVAAPPPTNVARKIEERQIALSPTAQRTLALTLDRYAVHVTSRGEATLFTLR
jgi:hypothetical protein